MHAVAQLLYFPQLFQVMERNLSSLKTDEAKLSAELQEKQGVLTYFAEEAQELKAKQDRVSLQVKVCNYSYMHVHVYVHTCASYIAVLPSPSHPQTSKLVKELKAMDKVCGHTPAHVQKDIELREMRDFGSNVVQKLGTLGSKDQDMLSAMQLMFAQAGLPPTPSPSGSRASSQASTARSSARSSARYAYGRVTTLLTQWPHVPSTYYGIQLGMHVWYALY